MKLLKLILVMLVTVALLAGCEEKIVEVEKEVIVYFDEIPAAPQNIQTVTADEAVYIYFNGVYETDIAEYLVYRSLEEFDGYILIGTVLAENNPLLDLIVYEYIDETPVNGITYFYAVSAVDDAAQVSALSAETALDTPRPEGAVTIFWDNDTPAIAGYNLASQTIVSSVSAAADIWLDTLMIGTDVHRYINVGNPNIDIQDMGYTSSFDEISFAPDCVDCWSTLGYTELIAGHTYVIWTASDNYAKMRVLQFNGTTSVTFQWGYQTAAGNLELKPVAHPRPVHDENYPATDKRSDLLR